MKEQLHSEMRKRQSTGVTAGTSDDLSSLRRDLNDSLSYGNRDLHDLAPVLLEHETRRLTDHHEIPVRHRSPNRRTLSPSIALRSMRAAASAAITSTASPTGRLRTSRPRF